MKVLIAEDTLVSRKFVEIALQKHGFSTVLANDGQDALELLARHPDLRLAIVDMLRPRLDGIERMAEMRAHDAWRKIPVIIATAVADMDTVRMATKLGCTRYLIKPVPEEELVLAVHHALGLKAPGLANGNGHPGGKTFPMTGLMNETALAELARLLPPKIQLLEQLVEGQVPSARAQELFELAKPAALAGARQIVDVLGNLGARLAYHDGQHVLPAYVALLKDLTILQTTISQHNNPILPIRSANEMPLGL